MDAATGSSGYLLQRCRGDEWPALLIPAERRVPNHYTALLELAGETPETSLQIEKDLPRTFAGRHELVRGSPTWGARSAPGWVGGCFYCGSCVPRSRLTRVTLTGQAGGAQTH
jgi:hypothetical protein